MILTKRHVPKDVLERLEKARRTNDRRDKTDREAGFLSPSSGSPELLLRTAMMAIWAGLQSEDWDCVAEAYEMLVGLHVAMTAIHYDPARKQSKGS